MYNYKINFELNVYQTKASLKIKKLFLQKKDILLEAVCGAGKTEMLLETIRVALNNGLNVGFACPRKQLIVELYERIKNYFQIDTIGLVTGEAKINIQSNFIFLTCHQLKRYKGYFNLLIVDEIDAFPFFNNAKLENDALLSSKQFIFLSATVPIKYLNSVKHGKLEHVTNFKRHHLKSIPVPEVKYEILNQKSLMLWLLIKKLKNEPLIIFVSNKKTGKKMCRYLKMLKLRVKFVCGENLNSEILDNFIQSYFEILISTTVLERGITLNKLNVIVYDASNGIFDECVLMQICGRVGRDWQNPYGKVYFIVKKTNNSIEKCIEKLRKYNEM